MESKAVLKDPIPKESTRRPDLRRAVIRRYFRGGTPDLRRAVI